MILYKYRREKQKRTCSGVSGASWLLTTVASASASAPTKPERKSRFVVSILVSAVGNSCRRCNAGFGKSRWQLRTGNLRRSEEAAWAPKNSQTLLGNCSILIRELHFSNESILFNYSRFWILEFLSPVTNPARHFKITRPAISSA